MEKKTLICVNCPKGCEIHVTLNDNHEIQNIVGFSCPKGKNYAMEEVTRPMRILTSTVKIENGTQRVLPVITSKAIPLDMTEEAMEAVRRVDVQAPVHVNEVLVKDFLHTGADLLASRSMKTK